MALRTLGTKLTTSLICTPAWSQVVAAADIAAIDQSICDDTSFGALSGGQSAGPVGVLGTGNTHSNTTLDTLVGVTGAPLTQIQVGDLILGPGIPAGTFVQVAPGAGTSLTMSKAATATAAISVAIVRNPAQKSLGLSPNGLLTIPNRGVLKLLPGDFPAIDHMGFPYLIPANAVAYAGSDWTLT